MELIKHLEWRYATKKFDPDKQISEADLAKIKRAVQLSASSYGLQLYKVIVIEDKELREKLRSVSWDQTQVTDASHLFVFCNFTNNLDSHIDSYLGLTANTRGLKIEDLAGYGSFMKTKINEKTPEQQTNWLERQPYIALANLLSACAELGIDACPMEGFEPQKYNEILGLDKKGLSACVIATVGYRSNEDQTQHFAKVRKPLDELFETI